MNELDMTPRPVGCQKHSNYQKLIDTPSRTAQFAGNRLVLHRNLSSDALIGASCVEEKFIEHISTFQVFFLVIEIRKNIWRNY